MISVSELNPTVLAVDPDGETEMICAEIRRLLAGDLRRRGLVVGVSGGIDSSVTLALAVRAIGPDRVLAIQMPERHSSEETPGISSRLIEHYGVQSVHEDITGILEAAGFYRRYDDAVRGVIPEYGDDWKSKIVLPSAAEHNGYNIFSVIAQAPDGRQIRKRAPHKSLLGIVAATNFKQRIRKMLEYYHADRLNYAVAGTPNRLEYDQGFFVKLGDGAADVKPIAHLYKTQVYALAEHLDVPIEIRERAPTTDTYSLPQGQDEFYFSLPYDKMDLCLYSKNRGYSAEKTAPAVGLTVEQTERVFKDIDIKRSTTRYLHLSPLLVKEVPEIHRGTA